MLSFICDKFNLRKVVDNMNELTIKIDYKLGIILCITFVFFLFYKINNQPNIDLSYVDIQAKVIEVKEKYIIVEYDKVSYLVYIQEDMSFIKNDIVNIKGTIKLIEKDLDIDVFEFATYLKNKRVFYCLYYNAVKNGWAVRDVTDFLNSPLTA